MKEITTIISVFLVGLGLGLIVCYFTFSPFQTMSSEQMYHHIINQRDFAIKEAIAHGDYNCCVESVCTMCYMEGNAWNHYEAGKCDCVDSIQVGEEPCPQCKRALSESQTK